jgi:hypothetical protein
MSAEASRERGTADAAAHGDSAGRQGSRRTPEGEVRSQRADSGEIPPEAREARFEKTDVSPRILFYALLGFFAAIAASAGFVALVLWAMSATVTRAPLDSLATRKLAPPAPRLETLPSGDRAAIEARAKARLAGYGAVEKGRARIPIERAMELLAAHGWPEPDEAASASRPAGSARSIEEGGR